MANVVVSAISTFNNKGLKKGKKEISAFEKQVKTFAKTFAAAFSVTALTRYGKAAVNAFVADEKAAKSLEQQLKNTGYQFSSPAVELYIANLQRTTGVLDDQLRPAFQKLLSVTGSITLSQDALATALDVSAAGFGSVVEVSQALAKGFGGQTTAIGRLVPGLNKAALKSGDMNKIMKELNSKFTGQSAARLTTYAGKMDLLKVASENVKEEIGKGILGALDALGKDTNIQDTTKKMEALGKQTGNTITGLGVLLKTLGDIPGIGLIGKVFYETSALGLLARLGKENRPARELPANEQRSAGRISSQQFKVEIRQKKELDRLRALELAALKKKTAVDQLRDKFDLERIGLTAALNAATDEETKLRLKAQLAILDNNEALAKKLLAEMEAAEAAKKLATSFTAIGDATIEYFKKLSESLVGTMAYFNMSMQQILAERLKESGKTSLGGGITGGGFTPLTASYFQNLGTQLQGSSAYAGMSAGQISLERARESGNRSLDVNVRIDSPSGDKFAQLVAESIQVAGRSGYSTTGAGQLP